MPHSKPQLFIIAGPNGAGKSTTSEKLLKPFEIKAFDWDKEFYVKWSAFGYDPLVKQGVEDATHRLFDNRKKAALDKLQSFAFETNVHQDSIFDTVEMFKSRGFQTNLYFLLITTVEICKARVEQRVKVDSGHAVSEETIEERFYQGLINLNKAVSILDELFLYDASNHYDIDRVAAFEKGNLVQKVKTISAKFEKYLPSITETLKGQTLL